jgi:bifunctional UDP-N-acetylglucosamine pyrophosphorylase/glucosamine-1-phosphate N-acetyltransferase
MRSSLPKVLHPVAGQPMVQHVLSVAREIGATRTVTVISPGADSLRASILDAECVVQSEQLGTGHAVLQARELLAGHSERVLVLYGDTPLVRPETARKLLELLDDAAIALLSAELDDPNGYGRVVRDGATGEVLRIVEDADAGPKTRAVREVNSGLMAFEAAWLWERLPRVGKAPGGEYYLTSLVELALAEGLRVAALRADDPNEILGIHTQAQLAMANQVCWSRVRLQLMEQGVTILDPASAYIDASVVVCPGTTIYPNTYLQGATRIGAGCGIGPGSLIVDSVVGDRSRVWMSVVEGSTLEADVQMGPFAHLRPGCYVESGVVLGNYSEAKNSRIGRDTQVHHFSYLGDSALGARVNVGAGTITCNYDGNAKHRTEIGDDAFIGSDTMLVAPITIGSRARTGAGSVVTKDVPDDATVVGVPARRFGNRSSPEPESGKAGQ